MWLACPANKLYFLVLPDIISHYDDETGAAVRNASPAVTRYAPPRDCVQQRGHLPDFHLNACDATYGGMVLTRRVTRDARYGGMVLSQYTCNSQYRGVTVSCKVWGYGFIISESMSRKVWGYGFFSAKWKSGRYPGRGGAERGPAAEQQLRSGGARKTECRCVKARSR